MRKSTYEPLAYLAGVLLLLGILSGIGRGGWTEYQNFNRSKTFHISTEPSGYSYLVAIPGGSYREFFAPGFSLYLWTEPDPTAGQNLFDVQIAHWLIALPIAAGATVFACSVAIGRKRVNSRLVRGQCVKCGYDLTATPDRCPECGTRVESAA